MQRQCRTGALDRPAIASPRHASVTHGEVRRSCSATSFGPYLAGARRPRTGRVTMPWIMSRCDMACCKSGRRSKRRRRNNPVLQRSDCGTGATPEQGPLRKYHAIGQLRVAPRRGARCDVYETADTVRRPRLLREDCIMKKASRMRPQKVSEISLSSDSNRCNYTVT